MTKPAYDLTTPDGLKAHLKFWGSGMKAASSGVVAKMARKHKKLFRVSRPSSNGVITVVIISLR